VLPHFIDKEARNPWKMTRREPMWICSITRFHLCTTAPPAPSRFLISPHSLLPLSIHSLRIEHGNGMACNDTSSEGGAGDGGSNGEEIQIQIAGPSSSPLRLSDCKRMLNFVWFLSLRERWCEDRGVWWIGFDSWCVDCADTCVLRCLGVSVAHR
jgi:hypothetical protein